MSVLRFRAVHVQNTAPSGRRRAALTSAGAAALVVAGLAVPQSAALASTDTSMSLSALTPVSA